MATNKGLYYYTKEEIDELLAAGPTVDNFTFTLTRVGYSSETLTGTRIKLSDDVYMYLYNGRSTLNTTSTGVKNYKITWNPAFDTIYGALMNAAFTGQPTSALNFVNFFSHNYDVDFYIYSAASSGSPLINFVVIGKPSS